MLRGLPASVILHVAVIGAGYVVLPTLARPMDQAAAIVPIELVDISEITNVAPQARIEPEEPEIEEPDLKDFLEDVDSLPAEEVVVEDEPALAEAEIAPPEPEPEPEVAPPEDEPEPEPEPEEVEPPADRPILEQEPVNPLENVLGDASNLFDRTPRDQAQAPPPRENETLRDETPAPSEQRRGAGEQTGNTASVVAMIQAQMRVCWNDVDGAPDPERLNVTIQFRLNRDGTLDGDVRLVDPARTPIGDRFMGLAIDNALRAARRCAPYRLPAEAQDFYEDWDEVTMNIGPAYRE